MAQAYRQREIDQPSRALSLYEKALDMEPGDPKAMTGIGWCYVDMQDLTMAVSMFKRVLANVPRYADAHFGLAEAYRLRGMKRDAVQYYRSYLDIQPYGSEATVAKRKLLELGETP